MYFILDNNVQAGYTSVTNMSVTLDGQAGTPFLFTPSGTNSYEYNALVYHSSNLPLGDHIVLLSSRDDSSPTLLMFDYAIYT